MRVREEPRNGILSHAVGAVKPVASSDVRVKSSAGAMNRNAALLAVILIYAAAFRLMALNRPFDYDAEGSGCLNGVLARSYLRFDWTQNHGMPILSLDAAHASPIVFYPDHPPLVPLLIVPVYSWFGVGAWQTRLPVSLLTIAAIFALYRLLARAATERIAIIAAGVFAATPMVLYFGGFPDVVGMPLVLFVLMVVSAYRRFHQAPGRVTFIPLVAAFAIAGFCDWPAYVIVPIVTVHFIRTRPRDEWRWIVAFGLAACALFAAVYVYITLATHSPWTWMAPLLERRSAMIGGSSVSWRAWLRAAIRDNRTYHTLPVLVASGLWLAAFGFRRRLSGAGATIARLLLAWAALYAVIGSKALFNHEWAWMPFTPGLAVATALALDWMLRRADDRGMARLAGWSVAAVIAVFAVWTGYATFTKLSALNRARPFTPIELGQAIQAAAPDRGDVALLVGGDEAEAQLWFYGDRPLRTGISSVRDFERRVDDDIVDLVYNFDEQPWHARATGIVFPRIKERDFAALHAYLNEQYPLATLPLAIDGKFEVFDLRFKKAVSATGIR